jgi:hypothetical protein
MSASASPRRRKTRAATTEEWANMEFEPESVAFRPDYWENFIKGAFLPMQLATAMLKKTKYELVQSIRKVREDDPCMLNALVEDMRESQKTLEKYASILKACLLRLMVADAVLEMETVKSRKRRPSRRIPGD